MPIVLRGVIHGKTIELLSDPGLADGQEIEMTIRPLAEPDTRIAAILRTAGSMADHPEFKAVMDMVQRDRDSDRYREQAE
jgi:hypothetical protein